MRGPFYEMSQHKLLIRAGRSQRDLSPNSAETSAAGSDGAVRRLSRVSQSRTRRDPGDLRGAPGEQRQRCTAGTGRSRGLKDILAAPERRADELIVLAGAARPEPVARLAVAVLTALAEAEGQVHGVPADQVHLHELGGVDTLVDTVGVAAAVCALGVTAVWLPAITGSSPLSITEFPRLGSACRH
jgi:Protein of unknown function DUF111